MQTLLTKKPQETHSSQPKYAGSESSTSAGGGLQESLGLPLFLQPKLAISQPDDPYEQEADRVAEQVMRMPDPASMRSSVDSARGTPVAIQRQCATNEDQEWRRKAKDSFTETSGADLVFATVRQSGRPLDSDSRNFFEPRFGRDFGAVRIHTNAQAVNSARSVNALAYTVGSNVVFNSGQYAPQSDQGRRLLAHELTHVVQQNQLPRKGGVFLKASSLEGEVERDNNLVTQIARTPASLILQRECATPLVADAERTVEVPYDPDFANFYRSMERLIGRTMVFRSDDGGRVRELTRQSLQDIHDATRVTTGNVVIAFALLRCSGTRHVEDIQLREVHGGVTRRDREPSPVPPPVPLPLSVPVPAVPPTSSDPRPSPELVSPLASVLVGGFCTAEAMGYASRFADDVLNRVEYDEETDRWNVNEGRDRGDWAQAMYDAWGHCYIAACMTRGVPEVDTWALGTFYEVLHEVFSQVSLGLIEHNSLDQDLYNQAVGREIGLHQPDGDLYEICFDAMMRGRLNLTLAGVVPRGRALVPRTTDPD
jgi:hypothetical protein